MRKQAEWLERTSELASDIGRSGGTWVVYEEYGIYGERDGRLRYIKGKDSAKVKKQEYRPLEKYDDLFLRFAHLADNDGLDTESEQWDSEKNKRAALRWAHEYGVLGLTPTEHLDFWGNDPRGGREDSVAKFANEAWVANSILRLYEAATNPRGVDMDTIASFIPVRYQHLFTSTPRMAAAWAKEQILFNINHRLGQHTYQQLYMRGVDGRVMEGYDFRSLLGAMYLQAMWLLQADNPLRCRRPACPNIIAFEQPSRGPDPTKMNDREMGYRTRADKEYCSKKCSNQHYYERVVKPLRQARQARRKVAKS